ncbi:MAG TPA: divergent polysaccharide deacetylase family protein [Candidatus Omnitrophota bacterium]|nr:divergent polysaccharide deacetylase family protein [Candidatus Omnitrophota bacterium]
MHNKRALDQRHLQAAFITMVAAITVISMIVLTKTAYQRSAVKTKKIKPAKGYIAIIIDDWGYNANVLSFLRTIKIPFAVAVLPKLPYSKASAQAAAKNGKEIMLHLPLEPHKTLDHYPKDYLLAASMSDQKIRTLIDENLLSVPMATGVNNHMGSKATETKSLMETIFRYLKKKDLFFVDSYVTERSACSALAKKMSLPFVKRDVFLDNAMDRSAIERQFNQLSSLAQTRGYAIGIGHAHTLTLQILREQSKILTEKGFHFLTVKEMIEHQQTLSDHDRP